MNPELAKILHEPKRLLFVGVGNVLKRDDGVGVVICREIKEQPGILTLAVEVSIENYIGKINSLKPEEIVILDCMDLGAKPGTYSLVALEQVEDLTFNTHNISLGRLADFFNYPTYVLGIQPLTVEFGDELSLPVQQSAEEILAQINH